MYGFKPSAKENAATEVGLAWVGISRSGGIGGGLGGSGISIFRFMVRRERIYYICACSFVVHQGRNS